MAFIQPMICSYQASCQNNQPTECRGIEFTRRSISSLHIHNYIMLPNSYPLYAKKKTQIVLSINIVMFQP